MSATRYAIQQDDSGRWTIRHAIACDVTTFGSATDAQERADAYNALPPLTPALRGLEEMQRDGTIPRGTSMEPATREEMGRRAKEVREDEEYFGIDAP
jgi:hypothetical protein